MARTAVSSVDYSAPPQSGQDRLRSLRGTTPSPPQREQVRCGSRTGLGSSSSAAAAGQPGVGVYPEPSAVGALYPWFRHVHDAAPQADLASRRRGENPETITPCPGTEGATHRKLPLGLTHPGNHLRLDDARPGIRSSRGTHIIYPPFIKFTLLSRFRRLSSLVLQFLSA